MFRWYNRLWVWFVGAWLWVITLAFLVGVAIWLAFFNQPAPAATTETEVTMVEITRVVEKVVKETVVIERIVTPVPTLPSLKVSASSLVTTTDQMTGTVPITATMVVTQGNWQIAYYSGATAEMKAWKFQDPLPQSWSVFPNVDHKVGGILYPAKNGLEYGEDKDFACEWLGCFLVASARHYRIWSGDGTVQELGYQCMSDDGTGCALMVVNVGEVTAEWEALLKRGFTIRGRYWDGKYLPQAIWAGLSHTAFNMLNLNKDSTNAGANCSSPDGCGKVRVTFVITSGKEVLMRGTTLVSR